MLILLSVSDDIIRSVDDFALHFAYNEFTFELYRKPACIGRDPGIHIVGCLLASVACKLECHMLGLISLVAHLNKLYAVVLKRESLLTLAGEYVDRFLMPFLPLAEWQIAHIIER